MTAQLGTFRAAERKMVGPRRATLTAGARADREHKGEAWQSRFYDNRRDAGLRLEPDEGPPGRGDARHRARAGSCGHCTMDVARFETDVRHRHGRATRAAAR